MLQQTDSMELLVKRHQKGIRVRVKVIPEIEEFFKQWGGGVVTPANTHGRLWRPMNDSDKRVEVWSFDRQLNSDEPYDIISSGQGLTSDRGLPNVSCLRLVGASQPEGREFIIDQVISNSEIRVVSNRLVKCAEQFYVEYIRPINLRLYVGVLDMSRVPPPQAPQAGTSGG